MAELERGEATGMSKSRKARSHRRAPLQALLLVAIVGAALAWWLLMPRAKPHAHRRHASAVAVVTPQAVEAPETPLPQATETPSPHGFQSPAATPQPAQTATPQTAQRPSPGVEPTAPASVPNGSAKLALIVDDCGQWLSTERGFVALDVPVTLSVLPDVAYTAKIAREAAGAGKGVMLHLPMETVSGLNPGPGKVTTEMSDAQIDAQVAEDLDQVPSVRGVNNHEGSRGSANERVMHDVIGVLSKRGNLFFIDSKTSAQSVAETVAREQGVPTAARDVFLDNVASVEYTERQLREAAEIAKRNGTAIAIGHPKATTLAAVRALIPELQAEGIQFVLASDLVGNTNP
jgi:polysaccharide deacetylase 2 family uncharacterized protein YibQ